MRIFEKYNLHSLALIYGIEDLKAVLCGNVVKMYIFLIWLNGWYIVY